MHTSMNTRKEDSCCYLCADNMHAGMRMSDLTPSKINGLLVLIMVAIVGIKMFAKQAKKDISCVFCC